jgi:hypothetical protein
MHVTIAARNRMICLTSRWHADEPNRESSHGKEHGQLVYIAVSFSDGHTALVAFEAVPEGFDVVTDEFMPVPHPTA